MKSPYVNELQPDQAVNGIFLVSSKEVRQKKTGEPYLSLILADKSGDIDAKMWDNAADAIPTFERDGFVRIRGAVQLYNNRPQLVLHKIQPVADAEVDAADFFPASKRDRDEMYRELQGWIEGVQNPHIKALLESIFADAELAAAYRLAPAAKSVHHAFLGGLIEHVLSMCQIARFTASHYTDIDFDLLLAGVLLHDIGKVSELSYSRSFSYSPIGQLIGHINIGTRMIEEKIREIPGFPPKLRDLIVHLVLSHHGALEYGSPKLPLFPEALLLHLIDNMDSKMECMRALIANDRSVDGVFTQYNQALERSALNKKRYLEGVPAPATTPVTTPTAPKPTANKPSSPFGAALSNALKK